MCDFSNVLFFERNYDVLKSKSPCILLNKDVNFNKNETESKMENPTHGFRETNLVLSSYKNHKLKVKLWWVGARKRKKRAFFVRFILSEGRELFLQISFVDREINFRSVLNEHILFSEEAEGSLSTMYH